MSKLLLTLGLATFAIASCSNSSSHADDTSGSSQPPAGKIIEISMKDNSYTPGKLEVRRGEKVTLRFTNDGAAKHEALVGTQQDQDDHAVQMKDSSMGAGDGMDMHHGQASDVVVVDPGQTSDLATTFNDAGEFLIGCHQPGHWEAGMKATLKVA